jgi:hypothetical protein
MLKDSLCDLTGPIVGRDASVKWSRRQCWRVRTISYDRGSISAYAPKRPLEKSVSLAVAVDLRGCFSFNVASESLQMTHGPGHRQAGLHVVEVGRC